MNTYAIFKLIHIVAVIVFLGNIYTGLFWIQHAHKTRNLAIIHHAFKGLILADRYFTIPGVIVILAGGVAAAMHSHISLLRTGWIFWSLVLFTISGVAFSWKLVPLQKKIYNLTSTDEKNFDWEAYQKLYKSWHVWGFVAIITPLLALAMMVLKWPVGSVFAR